MKTITYTTTALKQLARIDRSTAQRIRAKIDQYAADAVSLGNQVKALRGSPYARLRVGDYRVIFDDKGVVLTIIDVGHRRDVYR